MPGFYTPFLRTAHLHTHIERERDGRRDSELLGKIQSLSRERTNPKNSTLTGERVTISLHDHTTPCGMDQGGADGLVFRRLGAVLRRSWSQSESTSDQKSTKLDIRGRKCRTHTAKAQYMIQRRTRRKFWSTVHTFRGLIAVLRQQPSLKKVNANFTMKGCCARSSDHTTTGSHANIQIIV
jgi:hypothetical protein